MLQFLGWFDGKGWLYGIGSSIMGAIEHSIRTLSYSLVKLIYSLIIFLYDWFEVLCTSRLLSNSTLKTLSDRVGLILGLVMFFIVIFSLIKMLIEPDKINDKEMGAASILKKIIVVIIMFGISNYVFNALFLFQKTVINSQVISNLLLPYKIVDEDAKKFGNTLSAELLLSFYVVNEFKDAGVSDDDFMIINACKNNANALYNQIISSGDFTLGYNCLNENIQVKQKTSDGDVMQDAYIIEYNWLLVLVAGGFTVYLLFMYCLKVGIRMVQLMFLEIISPLAFVSYLSPKKETIFSKWIKIYISTYIDVFLRVAIINFVIFLIATIFTSVENGDFQFWASLGGKPSDSGSVAFLTIVIVLSLLTFAKRAPEMLKELLPAGASKLGFGMSMKDIVGLNKGVNTLAGLGAGAAVGLVGGFAGGRGISRFTGALGGALGGAFRGGKSGLGAKGFGNSLSGAFSAQSKANLRRQQLALSGAGMKDRLMSGFNSSFGIVDDYERLSAMNSSYSDIKSTVEDEQNVKNAQYAYNLSMEKWLELEENKGKTAAQFEESDAGKAAKAAVAKAKDKAYANLMKDDRAFIAKVEMHNKRFKTSYDGTSSWSDEINEDRKEVKGKFEEMQARKPLK